MTNISDQDLSYNNTDHLKRLFRRHVQGALVRSGASLIMWITALGGFLFDVIRKDQFVGVSGSVIFLIFMNPPTLWVLKRTTHFMHGVIIISISLVTALGLMKHGRQA